MHVLQTALRVVRHVDAEIFLIFGPPQRRDLVDRDRAVDKGLFQLVADEDVQTVAQLVGLGADQARPRDVDGLIELALGDVVENAAGQLADLGRDIVDKGLAAPDQIFIKARDRLVHRVGHAVRAVVVIQLLRLVLHEQGVAALVQRRKDVGDEAVLVIVRRHAHIAAAVMVGKGVLGRHQHQRALPQPFEREEVSAHGLLRGDRHRARHKVLANGLALPDDPREKRHDARLERGEEGVELFDAPALFHVVEAGVVNRRLALVALFHHEPLIADELAETVAEEREIVGLLGLQPGAVGLVRGEIHLIIELGRNVFRPGIVVIKVLHCLLLHVRQPLAVRVQLLDQRAVARRVRKLVKPLSEDRHVLSGLLDALLGCAALHVKADLADAAGIGLDLIEPPGQLFPLLLIRHIIKSFPYAKAPLQGKRSSRKVLAQMPHAAILAQGFSRVAHGAAVQHQTVAEIARPLRRQDFTQLALDLFRLLEVVDQPHPV